MVSGMICEGDSLKNLIVIMYTYSKHRKTICYVVFKFVLYFVNDDNVIALWTKCLLLNTTLYLSAIDLPHKSQAP